MGISVHTEETEMATTPYYSCRSHMHKTVTRQVMRQVVRIVYSQTTARGLTTQTMSRVQSLST